MKNLILITFLIAISIYNASAQRVVPDLSKSLITWTGHAEVGGYAPSGTLKLKSGSVSFNGDAVASADLEIDMNSLFQDNKNLTEHLKSEDFFDVKKYPLSKIHISQIKNGIAYGTLTIRDKSHPVEFTVNVDYKSNQVTVTGKTTIDRTQYGIVYNSTSFFANLGDHAIRNTFEVSFVLVVMH